MSSRSGPGKKGSPSRGPHVPESTGVSSGQAGDTALESASLSEERAVKVAGRPGGTPERTDLLVVSHWPRTEQ